MLYFLNNLQEAISTWLGLIRTQQISYRDQPARLPSQRCEHDCTHVQLLWSICGRNLINIELSAHATCAW